MTLFITFVLLVLASLVYSFRPVEEISQETIPTDIKTLFPEEFADDPFPRIVADDEEFIDDETEIEDFEEPLPEPLKEAA